MDVVFIPYVQTAPVGIAYDMLPIIDPLSARTSVSWVRSIWNRVSFYSLSCLLLSLIRDWPSIVLIRDWPSIVSIRDWPSIVSIRDWPSIVYALLCEETQPSRMMHDYFTFSAFKWLNNSNNCIAEINTVFVMGHFEHYGPFWTFKLDLFVLEA